MLTRCMSTRSCQETAHRCQPWWVKSFNIIFLTFVSDKFQRFTNLVSTQLLWYLLLEEWHLEVTSIFSNILNIISWHTTAQILCRVFVIYCNHFFKGFVLVSFLLQTIWYLKKCYVDFLLYRVPIRPPAMGNSSDCLPQSLVLFLGCFLDISPCQIHGVYFLSFCDTCCSWVVHLCFIRK